MEYNIANVLFLFAIIYSVAADSGSTEEIKQTVLDSLSENACPPFGKQAKFELETIHTMSLMYGCAYMGNESLQSTIAPFFHLWLERPDQLYGHGHCDNTLNMDHFIFECLSKRDRLTNKDESEMGWQYITLVEHTAESIQSKTKTRTYRCALYDVFDEDDRKIRRIRMAISKPVIGETFDVRQCNGLSDIFGRSLLPIIPEGYRYWPDGSLYIYLLGRKAKIFYTNKIRQTNTTSPPTTTTITSPPTTTTITSPPTTTTTTSPPTTTTTTSPPIANITISPPTIKAYIRPLTAIIVFKPTKNTTKNRPTEIISFSDPTIDNSNSHPIATFSDPEKNTTYSLPITTYTYRLPKINNKRSRPNITISYPTTNTTNSRPTTNTTIGHPTTTKNTT